MRTVHRDCRFVCAWDYEGKRRFGCIPRKQCVDWPILAQVWRNLIGFFSRLGIWVMGYMVFVQNSVWLGFEICRLGNFVARRFIGCLLLFGRLLLILL